jgi:hypothetical protein
MEYIVETVLAFLLAGFGCSLAGSREDYFVSLEDYSSPNYDPFILYYISC